MVEKDPKHPELRKGEVFVSNDGFFESGWKTKRQGEVAYDIYGNPLKFCHPFFVQRSELEAAGIKIEGKYNIRLKKD